MKELREFKEHAKEKGACDAYLEKWDKCGSKKQLIDLALSAQGMDYLSTSISEGWGLNSTYISNTFRKYINGEYIFRNEKGYDSMMFCNFIGSIEAVTTGILIIDSNIFIEVPKGHICEIYACGNNSIHISGQGEAVLVIYGDNNEIVYSEETKIKKICKTTK